MDPLMASLILFAGLIVVAASLTALAVTGSPAPPMTVGEAEVGPSASPPSDASRPAAEGVPVAIFCPTEAAPASVRLGVDGGVNPTALTVLQCEHFGAGPVTCEMDCLSATIAA